jgi:cation diffusion facilitator family transporter
MASNRSSKIVVYAALVGNLLVAVTKTIAAVFTGSSAMLSEAIHSFVDTGNEVLLLYGMRRSVRRPDSDHPLGYGRELYFWSFIVALLVFAIGAGVSVYQGFVHLRHPEPITNSWVNYVVLALAFLFEGSSWWVSLRQFQAVKGELSYYTAFRRSKDPTSFMVLFEDSAALIGILIAALGTYASASLGWMMADGIASILIGLILGGVSILLARESKSLLIGERADSRFAASILRIADAEDGVENANGVVTVQLAPNQVIAALSIEFADSLHPNDIEQAVKRIEANVRDEHPHVVALFIKPQTHRTFHENGDDRSDIPVFSAHPRRPLDDDD